MIAIPKPRGRARSSRAAAAAALAAAATLGGAAHAQQAPEAALETVTVTGTRLPDSTAVGVSRTLIGPSTIAAHDRPSVAELLAEAAGVHTSVPGGRGSVGEVLLRGGEPNFTAVLVDGIQMNDPTNTRGGSFDFSTLEIGEIQSVEILRGPMSSIYGSDALSGVINVITHARRDRLGAEAAVTAGGDDLASASVRLGGPAGSDHRFALNAGTLRDGLSDATGGVRSASVSGMLELFAAGDEPLVVRARHAEADLHAFPQSSGGPRLAVLRTQDRRHTTDDSLGVDWQRPVSPRAKLHVRATALDHGEDVVSPGVAEGIGGAIPANRSQAEFSRRTASVYLSAAVSERLDTAVGLDVERQRGDSRGALTAAPGIELPTGYSLSRDNVAVFGEAAYALTDTLKLGAALRRDGNGSARAETTSRLGLRLALPGRGTVLHVAWAKGYKLPSLFSLGDPLVGNPALRSEKVTSWEAGADIEGLEGRLRVELTAFSQRFEDLIDFDFEQFTTVNRDRVDTDGVEIGARFRADAHWTLLAHGTWVDLDVVGTDRRLRLRPERRGGLGVEWTPARSVTAYMGWRYVGPRLDASIPTGEITLPSYARIDASVDWRLGPVTSIQVAVDNVTDRRYEDAVGFPALGTRLRITLHAALRQGS